VVKLACVIWILPRESEQKYTDFLQKRKLYSIYSIPCNGTAGRSLLDMLGLSRTEKSLLWTVAPVDMGRRLMYLSETEMGIALPGSGIALVVPLDSVGGKTSLEMLTKGQTLDMERKTQMETTAANEFSLIVAVAQNGHTDEVMDAARSAGAAGGTVIHAKGTAGELAEKFLGVSLAAEKDMIIIVAKREERNAIMSAIMEKAGARTEARAILFSLPVDSVAGLHVSADREGQA